MVLVRLALLALLLSGCSSRPIDGRAWHPTSLHSTHDTILAPAGAVELRRHKTD